MRAFIPFAVAMLGTPSFAQQYYNENNRLGQQVEDYRVTVSQGVSIGAGTGAVIGGIVAAATRQRYPILGAIVGGGVGALFGGAIGTNIAEQKQRQQQLETSLDARIAHLRASNTKLAEIVETTDRLIAQRRREIAALHGEESDARARIADFLSKDSQLVQTALNSALRTRDELNAEVMARRDGGALNQSINQLKQQSRTLDAMGRSL